MILPMNEDILSLTDDYTFKAVLTMPDTKPALMELITAVIGHQVVDVQVRNNELPVTDIQEKNERLDVNCVIDTGDQVNVEMQGSRLEEVSAGHTNFINKTIYYLTDLHSSQSSKGVQYHELVRTYQITFCTYTVFPKYPGYVSEINMRRQDGELVTDQINAIIIELGKPRGLLSKPVGEMTLLEMWSVFLGYAADLRWRKLINEILERREAMAMAGTALRTISKDEHERAKRLAQKKFETDMTSNLLTAEERGERREREKWSAKVAEQEAALADKDAALADMKASLADKDAALADMNAAIVDMSAAFTDMTATLADMGAQITELRAQLATALAVNKDAEADA